MAELRLVRSDGTAFKNLRGATSEDDPFRSARREIRAHRRIRSGQQIHGRRFEISGKNCADVHSNRPPPSCVLRTQV
jgi:hypothetical protein